MKSSTDPQTKFEPGREPMGLRSAALTLLTVAFWGGTPVAIVYTVDTLPPVFVAGVRFAMAAIFMVGWCHLQGVSLKLPAHQRKPVLILGGMLFLQISTFNLGIQLANASHGTLFINTFIFWVAGIEHFVTRHDRLTKQKVCGLCMAAGGVLVLLRLDSLSPTGDLILLLSAFILGIKIVYTKRAVQQSDPGRVIFWHDVIGVAMFFLYSACFETVTLDDFPPAAIWGLLYQGVVVAGFCFAMQAELLKRHPAAQVTVFSFATPLFGITLAVLIRGEPLSPWLLVSGACVAAGILLVTTAKKKATTD